MTFTVLMTTFFVSFTVIENLLPRLYRQEFWDEFYQLVAELQREIRGVYIREDGATIFWSEALSLTECYEEDVDWEFWDGYEIEIIEEDPYCVRYPTYSFHAVQQVVDYFAWTYNMSITVWEVEPITEHLVIPALYHVDGRRTETDPMTSLDGENIRTVQENFYDIETGGFAIAVTGTFQPAYRVLNIVSALQQQILIAIFFISLAVSALFSRYLARPIVQLSEESKKLRELQFDETLKIKRRDEIGNLSSNLNFMSYKLKNALDDLQDANEKLKKEMEREREQERQRRNLFTSVSHELKTPITILKGEIGGMIDQVGAYKDRDAYLESAYGWTETLEKLVSEILTISRLEGEKMRLDLTQINISALLTEICHTHQTLADNQQVSFNQHLHPNLIIKADETQLQIAISNVINNAIFHTLPSKLVDVHLKQEGKFATLIVTNTGAHLEKEELKNLFIPFYRVDKSRNRHTGGSGLGLFIVKNILELHDFEYSLENVEDGVRFMIKMPLS